MSADALGNALQANSLYGFTSTTGSLSTVTIGTFQKMGKKKATIQVIKRSLYLYGEKATYSWGTVADKVSVSPHLLFPVDRTMINEN